MIAKRGQVRKTDRLMERNLNELIRRFVACIFDYMVTDRNVKCEYALSSMFFDLLSLSSLLICKFASACVYVCTIDCSHQALWE